MSVSIGNWELNRGPNSILVSTQNENGVAGKNVKLTKKDHLVTRPLLRFPGFFSFFSGPFKVVVYKSCLELLLASYHYMYSLYFMYCYDFVRYFTIISTV